MIRPSALQIAQFCGLAPRLAEQFPEATPAADRGTEIHAEIARALLGGDQPKSAEAKAAVAWVRSMEIKRVEAPLQLSDPETGDVITEGTVDLWTTEPTVTTVLDWKTGRRENVAPVDDNLQLLAYGLAAGLAEDAPGFRCIIAFLDGDTLTTDESRFYPQSEWWPLLERVKAAASKPAVATPGAHCAGCYQRPHCDSWRSRARMALQLVGRGPAEVTINDDTATELILRVQAVREAADLAEEMVRAHVRNGGRVEDGDRVYAPSMVNGRRSGPTVKELEAQGLKHLIREGKPSERWGWKRA